MDEKINDLFKKGDAISAEQAMQLAIDVASGGAPYVSPNPVVGCVIVSSDHKFLATGFHHKYGEAHAEIDALEKLSTSELKDATIYVTLEPCAHAGRTGSCAKKISSLAIKKVIYGLIDPNPLVAGKGAAILTEAGITVHVYQGPLTNVLQDLCEIFLKNFTQQKVFVAAKVASSLDGQIALKTGESKWITNEKSREYVHELRSYYDGLLIGRNTIEMDNPSLNIRHPKILKENKVIILDPQRRLLSQILKGEKYKFLDSNKSENIFFAVNNKIDTSAYQQIEFESLDSLLLQIWKLNLRSIFIEGGAKTYSSFLNAGLIDRLYVFLAPLIIGAHTGISWTKDFGIAGFDKQIKLDNLKTKNFAQDTFITGRISPRSKS